MTPEPLTDALPNRAARHATHVADYAGLIDARVDHADTGGSDAGYSNAGRYAGAGGAHARGDARSGRSNARRNAGPWSANPDAWRYADAGRANTNAGPDAGAGGADADTRVNSHGSTRDQGKNGARQAPANQDDFVHS